MRVISCNFRFVTNYTTSTESVAIAVLKDCNTRAREMNRQDEESIQIRIMHERDGDKGTE